MTNLLIREATIDDAEAVAGVHVRSWQQAYRGLIDQTVLDGLSVMQRAQRWAEIFSMPPTAGNSTVVALRGEHLLGWCSFGAGRDEGSAHRGEIFGIYVDPSRWSEGVGHALLLDVEHRLAASGYHDAFLWVLDGNAQADAFYERHGWIIDGGIKVDERPGLVLSEHRRAKTLRASLRP